MAEKVSEGRNEAVITGEVSDDRISQWWQEKSVMTG